MFMGKFGPTALNFCSDFFLFVNFLGHPVVVTIEDMKRESSIFCGFPLHPNCDLPLSGMIQYARAMMRLFEGTAILKPKIQNISVFQSFNKFHVVGFWPAPESLDFSEFSLIPKGLASHC